MTLQCCVHVIAEMRQGVMQPLQEAAQESAAEAGCCFEGAILYYADCRCTVVRRLEHRLLCKLSKIECWFSLQF